MSTTTLKFVINPQTSRPISVGGKVWKKLVRQGIIDGELKKRGRPKTKPKEPCREEGMWEELSWPEEEEEDFDEW